MAFLRRLRISAKGSLRGEHSAPVNQTQDDLWPAAFKKEHIFGCIFCLRQQQKAVHSTTSHVTDERMTETNKHL